MGSHRHGRGGGTSPLPWKCCKVFLCISNDSKTPSRRIIYALFSKHSSASAGFAPDPHGGSVPLPRWETEAPGLLICQLLEKILQAPMLSSYGDRTFAAAGPRLWNSLPVQLRNPDITYGLFRHPLKGHLFQEA